MATVNEKLLQAIKARSEKNTSFNRGILTADRYVSTLQTCVGTDMCSRFAAKPSHGKSFNDVLVKAGDTLTYSNDDMVKETTIEETQDLYTELRTELELPPKTLMVFRHVLTTPKKDRDGDILRTSGAEIDPKMPLLWQHTHTLPIGKYLKTAEHTDEKLCVYSCLIGMNELCDDAAVMVESGMGRFSHGFKALEYTTLKEADGRRQEPEEGFDVTRFEIMEESLVSVPANTDAVMEDLIIELSEKKFTSPMMKSYGNFIKDRKRKTTVAVAKDVESEKESKCEHEETAGKCQCGGSCGKCSKEDAAPDQSNEDGEKKTVKPEISQEKEYQKLKEELPEFIARKKPSLAEKDWFILETFSNKVTACCEDGKNVSFFSIHRNEKGFTGLVRKLERRNFSKESVEIAKARKFGFSIEKAVSSYLSSAEPQKIDRLQKMLSAMQEIRQHGEALEQIGDLLEV